MAVLHYWGSFRPWTLSGHFHETSEHDLIHIIDALSGLPLRVNFISFEDIKEGKLENYDVVINAGKAGTAWSGGDVWKEEKIVSLLNQWVYNGGAFLGVDEPSATEGYCNYFRMAEVPGVDKDIGAKVCHGRWKFETTKIPGLLPEDCSIPKRDGAYLTDGNAKVLLSHDGVPGLTINRFGKGCGVYLGGFEYSPVNARMLLNLILWAADDRTEEYLTDNAATEYAYYPEAGKPVVINNTNQKQSTSVQTEKGQINFILEPYAQKSIDL